MITLEESGLSSTNYNLLKDARESPDWFVVAHQYNLEFTAHHTGTQSESGANWDAAVVGSNIYRAVETIVEKYNGSTWSDVTGFTLPTGSKNSRPISLVGNSNDLHVFVPTLTGISENIYNGTSWSGWSEIITESGVEFVAAVNHEKIHYLNYNSTEFHWNFKVAEDDSGWDSTASDIFWPYIITSFDAESNDDTDIIVFTSNTPGEVSAKYVNNEVVKYIVPAGGIVGITYKNATWSDHFFVDVVDEKTDWRNRLYVRISNLNDKFFITSYTSDGTELYPITLYRFYTSKDGRHWSRGEAPSLPSDVGTYGIKLLALGDYIFALTRKTAYRSYSTLYTNLSPSAMQLDITSRVEQYSRNWQEIQQISLVINNEDAWITGTILDGTNRILLEHQQGYFVNDPVESVVVTIAITEVDTISNTIDLPRNRLRIVSRDFMAWMNDRTQSESYKDWEPQLIGGDDYTDTTGTGYGGLAHTATLAGAWKTIDDELSVLNNNKESSSMSDFTTDTWNGFAQVGFTLAQLANEEFAGVAFRVQDKDNLDYVKYSQDNDRLEYYQRRAGTDTSIENSSTLSWDADLNTRYLRVEFKYCSVKAYASSDNITWTEEISAIVSGQSFLLDPFHQAGGIGLIAKGFSDQDTWSGDPGSISSGGIPWWLEPDNFLFPPAGTTRIIMLFTNLFYYTFDFDSVSPTWGSSDPDLDVSELIKDGVPVPGISQRWAVVTNTKLRVYNNVVDSPALIHEHTLSGSSSSGRSIQIERSNPDIIHTLSYRDDGLYWEGSHDGGLTMESAVQIGGNGTGSPAINSVFFQPALYVDPSNSLICYTIGYTGSAYALYKTSDGGLSWATSSDYNIEDGVGTGKNLGFYIERSFTDSSRIFFGRNDNNNLQRPEIGTSSAATLFPSPQSGAFTRRGVRTVDNDADKILFVHWQSLNFGDFDFQLHKSLDGADTLVELLGGPNVHNFQPGGVVWGDGESFVVWNGDGIFFHESFSDITDFADMDSKNGTGFPTGISALNLGGF